jgi:uncharacterized RDD family membrane protein YckC
MESFVVRTPENVEFRYELAGVFSRWMAWAIDATIIAIIVAVGSMLIALAAGFLAAAGVGSGWAVGAWWAFAFATAWLYNTLFEWLGGGATPGKKLLGIRVIGVEGLAIDFPQSFLRNTLRLADLAPGGIAAALVVPDMPVLAGIGMVGGCMLGACFCFFSRWQQRAGDIAAGTVVVRLRESVMPSRIIPQRDRYNSLAENPAVRDSIRRTITVAEKDLLVSLCLRGELLDLPVRTALFSRAAEHFRKRLGIARIPGISDEKFVRNIALVAVSVDEREFSFGGGAGYGRQPAPGPAGLER